MSHRVTQGDSRPQERWLETHPGDINPLPQVSLASPLKGLRINNRIVKMIYRNNFYKKKKTEKNLKKPNWEAIQIRIREGQSTGGFSYVSRASIHSEPASPITSSSQRGEGGAERTRGPYSESLRLHTSVLSTSLPLYLFPRLHSGA